MKNDSTTRSDVLSQVAEAFRLRGSCGGVFALSPPWVFAIPASDHASLMVVTRGRAWFDLAGHDSRPIELSPGDVVAMPHGHGCTLRDDPRTPIAEHAPEGCTRGDSPRPGEAQTEMVGLCCELAGGRTNPFFRVLPPLIYCRGSDGRVARWLDPTVRMLATESSGTSPGRNTILNRLAEVAFIQLIRSWIEDRAPGEGGWLRALADPQIAVALDAIHAQPGASWTVASLADRAGMSRSAFASRFKSLVGETPLEYLTRWRMQRAADLLAADVPVKQAVVSSGYTSEAAFRIAFRKWAGVAPGLYRDRLAAQSAAAARSDTPAEAPVAGA